MMKIIKISKKNKDMDNENFEKTSDIKNEEEIDLITCPFCNDSGFDKVGLKYHLETHCKVYAQTKELKWH